MEALASLLYDISTFPKEILSPGCQLQHLWLGGMYLAKLIELHVKRCLISGPCAVRLGFLEDEGKDLSWRTTGSSQCLVGTLTARTFLPPATASQHVC